MADDHAPHATITPTATPTTTSATISVTSSTIAAGSGLPGHLWASILQNTGINTLCIVTCVSKELRGAALNVLGQDLHHVSIHKRPAPHPRTRISLSSQTHGLDAQSAACGHVLHVTAGTCDARDARDIGLMATHNRSHQQQQHQKRHEQHQQQKQKQRFEIDGMAQGVAAHVCDAVGFMACLRSVLRHVNSLVTLDLRWAFQWMGDSAMQVLGTCAPTTLRHLVLKNCSLITSAGLQRLCDPGALSNLESLVLHGCGDIGTGAPLGQLKQLTYLDCSWCMSLTSQGVSGVCSGLERAYFRGCDLIGDDVCTALTQAQELDLAFTRVTNTGLATLASSPTHHLKLLVLAAPTHNIYSTGLWTEEALRVYRAQRPDVQVKLVTA